MERFVNDVATTLNGTITSGATSLVVTSATGFPAANFRVRIDDEYLLVTAVAGTTWTVTRAQEGSAAVAHTNGAAVTHVLTAGGLAQAIRDSVDILLDYTAATDINSGTAMSASVWTDIGTNQSFTVVSASSVVEIAVRGNAFAGANGLASSEFGSRIVIDSAGTPIIKPLGGGVLEVGTSYVNVLAGGAPIKMTGLSAGTHTIKVQAMCSTASTMYCRAATQPGIESYAIQVTEMAG